MVPRQCSKQEASCEQFFPERPNGCRDDHFGSQGRRCNQIVRWTIAEIRDEQGSRYTEPCSPYRQSEGNREPCEPIPSWCLASTHVKSNAVSRRARKCEKGSKAFDEENRDDFVVGYGATEKECGEDEFIFGRRPGLHTRLQRLIPPFLPAASDTADSFLSLAARLALDGYIPLLGKPVH